MEKTVKNQHPIEEENKMGYMPINKLIISISLPMMLSMLVQSMYNIVDSIYVSRLSENALSAVSLAFPMQSIMTVTSAGLGVGVNALLSRNLGQKNREGANLAANNGIHISLICYIFFALIGLLGAPAFFRMQTDISEIIDFGTTYLRLVQVFAFGTFGQFLFERLLQSTGKTVLTMITQSIGAILNIILDPIFIFGYFGVPAMGIAGAAIATVIGQTTATVLAIVFNFKYNKEITINPFKYLPHFDTIKQIFAVGLPTIAMASIGSAMSVFINQILLGFTSTAIAVNGAYNKLHSFIFMPVLGLNNGVVPIISYNFGARNRERMMKAIKLSCTYAAVLMLIGTLIMQLFAKELLSLFEASDFMLSVGIPALRILSIGFVFTGFNIIMGSVFQALGNGMYSMLVSMARQLCILLPLAYIMSLTRNLNLVWLAFVLAEVLSIGFSIFFFIRIYKNVISHIAKK